MAITSSTPPLPTVHAEPIAPAASTAAVAPPSSGHGKLIQTTIVVLWVACLVFFGVNAIIKKDEYIAYLFIPFTLVSGLGFWSSKSLSKLEKVLRLINQAETRMEQYAAVSSSTAATTVQAATELTSVSVQLANTEQKMDDYKGKYIKLQHEMEALKKAIAGFTTTIEKLSKEMPTIASTGQQIDMTGESLSKLVDTWKEVLEQAVKEKEDLTKRLEDLNAQRKQLSDDYAKLEENQKSLRETEARLTNELEEAKKDLAAETEKLQKAQVLHLKQIEQQQASRATLVREFTEFKKTYAAALDVLSPKSTTSSSTVS